MSNVINPRRYASADKFCKHIHPDDHKDLSKAGNQCKALKMKDSDFCWFHQPDKSALREQLAEARSEREARKHRDPVRKIEIPPPDITCATCTQTAGCPEYIEGYRGKCPLFTKAPDRLSSMVGIKIEAEQTLADFIWNGQGMKDEVIADPHDMAKKNTFDIHLKRKITFMKDYAVILTKYKEHEILEEKYAPSAWMETEEDFYDRQKRWKDAKEKEYAENK